MATSDSHCKRLLVAAMDFGTTFSGYAFSFHDKPLDIHTNPNWIAGSEKLISLKSPTCVLLKPNKEFHSFGFEAENKYSDLAEDKMHHGWYLFRRFKMILYETKNITMDSVVEDIAGNEMPALTIFAHAIRYLKNHLLNTLKTRATGILESDIQYVLTVPAIWDEKAKQFMRKAAEKAGIEGDQLKMALEPEAASIWCQVVTDQGLSKLANVGSKYMVVDLGGGTADITVHQKLADGSLKEIHKATGGAWGGTEVDKAYLKMLTDVVGIDPMHTFKTQEMSDYVDILRDFETKKRTITTETDGKLTFKIPARLRELAEVDGETMKQKIERTIYRGKMTWASDKIRLEKVSAQGLFKAPIEKLIGHIKALFSDQKTTKMNDVNVILLVGGFGECALVNAAFEKAFSNKVVIVPADAGLVVLKGAVRFGHLPEIVSTRLSQFAYGIEVGPDFDEKLHEESRRSTYCGQDICNDVFCKMVDVGDEIPFGKEVTNAMVVHAQQETVYIKLFSSTTSDPKYVTDNGCSLLGTVTIDIPKSDILEDKLLDVILTFGDTELKVKVIIMKTQKAYDAVIKCM